MEDNKLSEMSISEIKTKIRDMYKLKRDLYGNISRSKMMINDANAIIDLLEKELRERGRI